MVEYKCLQNDIGIKNLSVSREYVNEIWVTMPEGLLTINTKDKTFKIWEYGGS